MILTGLAINQERYLSECIRKRLAPFVQEYFRNGKCLSRADIISCNFAKSHNGLRIKNVKFVQKTLILQTFRKPVQFKIFDK